jgi:hypothetical protein
MARPEVTGGKVLNGMVNRLFRAVIGLFLFTPWLWRAYQTY